MKTIKRFRLSIEHLWSLTALVGVFIFASTHPIRPHDFWWHMAVGREIVQTGSIPTVDVYSYTMPGEPYASYQMFWLMEVLFYLVYSLGGPALIVFAHSLVITATYGLVIWLGWRRSGSWRLAAFAGLFAAALGMFDWNVRPQAITFLLGAVFLVAMQVGPGRRGLAWVLVFPLGMALWANSHGTFPLGLLLIGLWLLDEAWQRLLPLAEPVLPVLGRKIKAWFNQGLNGPGRGVLVAALALALALLACLLNPRGLGILDYVLTLTGNPAVQKLVTEWAPPSFDSLGGGLFLGGLLLSALILAISPRRPSPRDLLAFLAFAALGLKTSRGVIWYGLVMAPVLADHLGAIAGRMGLVSPTANASGSRALNRFFVGVLLFMACMSLPWFKSVLPLPEEKAGVISAETPIAATQYLLDEKLPAPIFHDMSFGSYLIWAAQPDYPVFVDGRIELYPLEIWQDYMAISSAQPGWEEKVLGYGVQTLFLSPVEQAGLAAAAQDSPLWQMVYRDAAAVIFVYQDTGVAGMSRISGDFMKIECWVK